MPTLFIPLLKLPNISLSLKKKKKIVACLIISWIISVYFKSNINEKEYSFHCYYFRFWCIWLLLRFLLIHNNRVSGFTINEFLFFNGWVLDPGYQGLVITFMPKNPISSMSNEIVMLYYIMIQSHTNTYMCTSSMKISRVTLFLNKKCLLRKCEISLFIHKLFCILTPSNENKMRPDGLTWQSSTMRYSSTFPLPTIFAWPTSLIEWRGSKTTLFCLDLKWTKLTLSIFWIIMKVIISKLLSLLIYYYPNIYYNILSWTNIN